MLTLAGRKDWVETKTTTEFGSSNKSDQALTGRAGLTLEVTREGQFVLPVTRATLLALIVNELVVNAAVHAFPNGRGGYVRLAVRKPDPLHLLELLGVA